ncbi:hypothetical protein I302_108577 [Kwoniella bestiolae CBS 10118]|uniref:Uncharacterized protein n=1 Tax=Kwoniella bestiolae CBS 10118 TaxID=1296100 RepID=A0A1B9FTH4_9TREE|nr:hypothetical protein I302_07715 [Kwoniella bestiolae CBS 10118]OCF22074.1 hypothetical protein I302_07715 [Kwoniella bestiolae CBS 10118]
MEAPMQAPPPQNHAGNDDNLIAGYDSEHRLDMLQYKNDTPLWKRVHQHSLTQMIFIFIQAFCGPAMWDAKDAISGLGGGGLATASTSNITFALYNGFEALFCLFGSVLVNILGAEWSLVLAAATLPLFGASYKCNSQFSNQWFRNPLTLSFWLVILLDTEVYVWSLIMQIRYARNIPGAIDI